MTIRLADKKADKRFLKRLSRLSKRRRMPFSIMFELTYKCNFNCPHCYLSLRQNLNGEKELTTKEIFFILTQLKDMGVYRIGFTGGEPLLRKDIFDILSFANKCGFKFGILTNGYLINEQIADKLKKTNVDKIDITFNSLKPEIFYQLTGVKDSLQKVKRAIEILVKRNIQVIIKSTCMRQNKDEIIGISRYARNLNIPYRIDSEILPCSNNCTTWVNEYSISAKEFQDLRRKIYPEMFRDKMKRGRVKWRRKRERIFNCGAGINSFSINPYGKMNFCAEIDYPNYDSLTKGAKVCWEQVKRDMDKLNKRKDFICRDCNLFNYCGWCPGRSFIESGSFNRCSEYFKERAIEKKNERRICA